MSRMLSSARERRALPALGMAGLVITAYLTAAALPAAAEGTQDRIVICHATSSPTRPYVETEVDGDGLSGHGDHEGDLVPVPAGGCPGPSPTQPPAELEPPEEPADPDAREEPEAEEPVAEEPTTEEPTTEEPVTEEPTTEEPVTEEPVTEEPVTEEPVTEEPVTEEPVTEEPEAEQPVAEEPTTEEPVDDGPGLESTPAEEPAPEKPAQESTGVSAEPTKPTTQFTWDTGDLPLPGADAPVSPDEPVRHVGLPAAHTPDYDVHVNTGGPGSDKGHAGQSPVALPNAGAPRLAIPTGAGLALLFLGLLLTGRGRRARRP